MRVAVLLHIGAPSLLDEMLNYVQQVVHSGAACDLYVNLLEGSDVAADTCRI